jgi:hypothetical protein
VSPHVFVAAHAKVTSLADVPWGEYGARTRDLKQMSRHMQLAVAAALRCRAIVGATADAWEELPVFVACPTGREITAPFAGAVRSLPSAERSPLCAAVFAQGGVNILDFLKGSAGTIAGYVAKYAGARGLNASASGYGADYFALQKASLLLRHGDIAQALVVGGESLREVPGAPDDAPEAGAAVLLTCRAPSPDARAFTLHQETGTASDGAGFEAIPLLTTLIDALGADRAVSLGTLDPYGRHFRARVERVLRAEEAYA